MTTDDPWATTTPAPTFTPWQAYEQALSAAGYGDEARRRYIAESGDQEYAECEWDNNIVPAAEAAGLIPEPPPYEPTVEEQVREWCSRAAGRQFDAAHGNPAPWDLTQQDADAIDALAQRLAADHGEALAAFLQGAHDDPTSADYEARISTLFADTETEENTR